MGFFGTTLDPAPAAEPRSPSASAYERKRAGMAAKSRAESAAGREVGDIPEPEDKARRDACEFDFRLFCETYRRPAFPLAWSDAHLELIAAIQRAVLEGAQQSIGFPRGSGKTSLAEAAVEWATLYGHRRLALVIASEEGKAGDSLEAIKKDLETNPLLLADFPEVVIPIRRLGRTPQRAKGQTHEDAPTYIEWGTSEIVLPTIPGSKASGACIAVAGLDGSHIRGVKRTLPTGEVIRPDLVLVDDPQTRKSARSPSMSRTRELTIVGDVLGMAGPGQSISVLMACTVIYRGDLSDRMLDRNLHPDWRGIRRKLLPAMPERMDLWRKYWDTRAADLQRDGDGSAATEFYRANREEMDRGAVVMWPERFKDGEISAVENAMKLFMASPETFGSEYQNEPIAEAVQEAEGVDATDAARRVNRVARKVAPKGCETLTAQIDVHDRLLFWTVCAWGDGFGGAVIDYGTFPDQRVPVFTLADCPRPMTEFFREETGKAVAVETAVEMGLDRLANDLMGRHWRREDSDEPARIAFLLIDEGYDTEIVRRVIRRSPHRPLMRPSKGRAVGPHESPMAYWKVKDGEKAGPNWLRKCPPGTQQEHVQFDANAWKTFARNRLAAVPAAPDALTLFGGDPLAHALFADHLAAEFPTTTEGKGRVVEVWKNRPGRDNHFFDNIVGCAVAASVRGIRLPTSTEAAAIARPAPARQRRRGISKWGGTR
jgi:hypothetical protein